MTPDVRAQLRMECLKEALARASPEVDLEDVFTLTETLFDFVRMPPVYPDFPPKSPPPPPPPSKV